MFFRKKRLIFVRLMFPFIILGFCFPHYLYSELNHKNTQALTHEDKNKDVSPKEAVAIDVAAILDSVPFVGDVELVIDDHECEELGIDQLILHWKKYTTTKLDVWGLKKLLKFAPKGSKDIIRYVIENDAAFNVLQDTVNLIKKNEDALYCYWDKANRLHNNISRLYYSILKKYAPKIAHVLNNNRVALEASQFLEMAKPWATLLASFGITGLAKGLWTAKVLHLPFSWKASLLNGFKEPIRNHMLKPAVYKCEAEFDLQDPVKMSNFFNYATVGDCYIVVKVILKSLFGNFTTNEKISDYVATGLSGGSQLLFTFWQDYTLLSKTKGAVDTIIFLHKNTKKLQHTMCEVANIMRGLKQGVEKLSNSSAALGESGVVRNILAFLNKENVSKKVENVLELLNSSTFNKKASLFYAKGRLLKTHRLLSEIKEEFIPLLQQVALLSGYMAIAKLFKDHQDSEVKFCFVHFVEQEKPLIKLKNAWLPLISEKEVVPNSIELGTEDGASSAVITGPNGGGKTTVMITVAVNALLSRLGIAAAEQAYMTTFEEIKTSLNPKQDISAKLSSFMAEQKRADQVYNAITKSKGNILVLLDEPYKGTVESESANRVYKFGKKIANVDHCILLMATHLEKPICLADDTAGKFANYQMGFLEQDLGTFIRTFKLEVGAAVWWFKDEDKRSNFIDWLCTEMAED